MRKQMLLLHDETNRTLLSFFFFVNKQINIKNIAIFTFMSRFVDFYGDFSGFFPFFLVRNARYNF
jgi:hypothetical protein